MCRRHFMGFWKQHWILPSITNSKYKVAFISSYPWLIAFIPFYGALMLFSCHLFLFHAVYVSRLTFFFLSVFFFTLRFFFFFFSGVRSAPTISIFSAFVRDVRLLSVLCCCGCVCVPCYCVWFPLFSTMGSLALATHTHRWRFYTLLLCMQNRQNGPPEHVGWHFSILPEISFRIIRFRNMPSECHTRK